jgi:hypothetical protein
LPLVIPIIFCYFLTLQRFWKAFLFKTTEIHLGSEAHPVAIAVYHIESEDYL